MKTDNYASKFNDKTVFVKCCSASVQMHVETPSAPSYGSGPLVPPTNYSEPRFHKSLNSCNDKQLFLWPRHKKLV